MIRPGGKRALSKAGFTRREIDLIDIAQAPDGTPQDTNVTMPLWRSVMRSRRQYVDVMRLRGYSQKQIAKFINGYYDKPEKSPFDFLKAEYRSPKKLTNFQRAMKIRKQRSIQVKFGSKYGTKTRR